MDNFDKILKERARTEKCEIPGSLECKIDNILKELPEKEIKRKKVFSMAVAAVALVAVMSVTVVFGLNSAMEYFDFKSSNVPKTKTVGSIQVEVGEKDEYGGTVIAIDKFDNNCNVGALRSISKDGRYYLFQLSSYDLKTHQPSDNGRLVWWDNVDSDNGRLVLWDNVDKKAVYSIKGRMDGVYMVNPVLDMENKRVYYTDMNSIKYIDFKKKEKVDVLSKYKIEPGKEYTDEFGNPQYNVRFFAVDKGTLFVSIRTQKDSDNPAYSMYRIKGEECKKINMGIKEKIDFMDVLGTIEGSRLMLRTNTGFYITDFDGNVLGKRPVINNKDLETNGLSYMYPSYDGKKLLYSLGKTPTDLYVYDFETKEVKVLCPGGRNYLGMNVASIRDKYGECYNAFWAGNDKIVAKIRLGDTLISFGIDSNGDNSAMVAKEYKIE
jgi:hypothetical protein